MVNTNARLIACLGLSVLAHALLAPWVASPTAAAAGAMPGQMVVLLVDPTQGVQAPAVRVRARLEAAPGPAGPNPAAPATSTAAPVTPAARDDPAGAGNAAPSVLALAGNDARPAPARAGLAPDQAGTRGAHAHAPVSPPAMAEFMARAQLAALRAQREAAHRAAVSAGLAGLVPRLPPVLAGALDCSERDDGSVGCSPEPGPRAQGLVRQFATLAIEARRLGLVGNPVEVELGDGQLRLMLLR